MTVSGALSWSEPVLSLSLKTRALELVLLPRRVTVPLTLTLPEVIEPVVLIVVDPVIREAKSMVAELRIGLVSVLFMRVSVASRVTM